MRKRLIVIVLLLSFTGCNLLQKTTKSSVENRDEMKTETALKLQSTTDLSRYGAKLTLSNVAVDADYKIQFYPNGQLKVNMDGSIIGSFDSILLAGKHKQLRTMQEKSEFKEQENQQKELSMKQKLSKDKVQKEVEKQRKPAENLGIIILIAIILVIIMLFISKLYRKMHLFS